MTDQDTWLAIQHGSESAFRRLFDAYYLQMVKVAYSYLQDWENAREVVQNLFVSFWEKRGKLEIKDNVKAYLMVSTRNHCLNFIHKKKLLFSEEMPEIADRNPDISTSLDDKQQIRLLANIIRKMPPACRLVFLLRRRDNLSIKEIAATLEISAKTVENQLTKAMRIMTRHWLVPVFFWIWMKMGW